MNDHQSDSTSGPTAQEIFGLPQGSRIRLQRTMKDSIFEKVASSRPDVGTAIDGLSGQTATAVTVNSDLVELRLDQPVTIGGAFDNVTVHVARAENGSFRISLSGDGTPPLQQEVSGLTVRREGARFVFADGDEPRVRFTPKPGSVKVEVFTAPFLVHESGMVKAFAPKLVDLFGVTVLDSPPAV